MIRKSLKPLLFFYNSILIIFLITIGTFGQSYEHLAPTLLLLPVGLFNIFALANQLTDILEYVKTPTVHQVRRLFSIYSFLIALLLVIAASANGGTIAEASLTIVFFPLLLPFILALFSKKNQFHFRLQNTLKLQHLQRQAEQESAEETQFDEPEAPATVIGSKKTSSKLRRIGPTESEDEPEEVKELELVPPPNIEDARRRQFLKILGGGGVSLFLMTFIMPGKANAAFFGSTPGPGVIALKDTSGAKIDPAEKQPTDGYTISEIDDASSPSYYGFIHKNGAWYIAREDSAGAYRYAKGSSNFSTSWTGRAGLTYAYFDVTF